jgi:hypothetical protein
MNAGRRQPGEPDLVDIKMSAFEPSPAALELVPVEVAFSHGVLPLNRVNRVLVAVISGTSNPGVAEGLRALAGCEVKLVRTSDAELREALLTYYGHPWPQPVQPSRFIN